MKRRDHSRPNRLQKGNVFESGGFIWIRFYTTELVNGQLKRVQQAPERLCPKDAAHFITKHKKGRERAQIYLSPPLEKKRAERMATVNARALMPAAAPPQTIADFWDTIYLPFLKENKRASTVSGYEKIWAQHLKPHFGQMTFKEYEPYIGSRFLSELAKTLGRNTLSHIRSLASGIFSYAISDHGLLKQNPWRDVKVNAKVRAPEETKHYALEEAENAITALVDCLEGQTVFALAYFEGLRPSEIGGLQWGDIDEDWLHVRRGVVRGVVAPPKTAKSIRSLPLIEPVKTLLALWRQSSDNPSEGWVFQNKSGDPRHMEEFPRRVIKPLLEAKGIEWKGMYAGRRGLLTLLTDLTGGDPRAAAQAGGHTNMLVAIKNYIKENRSALAEGMQLAEARHLELAAKNGGRE